MREAGAQRAGGAGSAGGGRSQPGPGSAHTVPSPLTAEAEQLRQQEKSPGLTVSPVTWCHLTESAQMTGI